MYRFGPEAHRFADIADCGSSKAQIGATLTLASGKSRAVDSESTQRPMVLLLAQWRTRTGILQCVSALTVSLGRYRGRNFLALWIGSRDRRNGIYGAGLSS